METIPKIPQTLVCGIFLSAFTAPFQKAMPAHQDFAPFNFARSAESKCAGQRKEMRKKKFPVLGGRQRPARTGAPPARIF